MFFFLAPEKFKTKCPQRYAFIKSVVDGWSAKPAPDPASSTTDKPAK